MLKIQKFHPTISAIELSPLAIRFTTIQLLDWQSPIFTLSRMLNNDLFEMSEYFFTFSCSDRNYATPLNFQIFSYLQTSLADVYQVNKIMYILIVIY